MPDPERISISKLLDMANRARWEAQQMKEFIKVRGLLTDFEEYQLIGTIDRLRANETEYLGHQA